MDFIARIQTDPGKRPTRTQSQEISRGKVVRKEREKGPELTREVKISRLEAKLRSIKLMGIAAPGAKEGRLQSLKEEVDKILKELRKLQDKLRKQRTTFDGQKVEGLDEKVVEANQRQELNNENKAENIAKHQRQLAELRTKVNQALGKVLDSQV